MDENQAPEDFFAKALQGKLPALTSQAQYNAFMASFDALCFTMNAICGGNKEQEAAGLKALDQSFDIARKVTDITNKLKDVPEAAMSKDADEYKKPPSEFGEYDVQRTLLSELEAITTYEQFYAWYTMSKDRREQVKTQSLRNVLYDTIRAKNATFKKD